MKLGFQLSQAHDHGVNSNQMGLFEAWLQVSAWDVSDDVERFVST